ncbi:MAG: hypothetical protein HYY17_08700, partial [Planctomycetes bacterium]|nr:hypothetical protein [Planctomycetota bacterium]
MNSRSGWVFLVACLAVSLLGARQAPQDGRPPFPGPIPSIEFLCPPAIAAENETVVLVAGTGLSAVREARVNGQPVRAVALHDSVLDLLLPHLARGTHRVELVTDRGAVLEMSLSAVSYDERAAIEALESVRRLVVFAQQRGVPVDAAAVVSVSQQIEGVERKLEAGNLNGARGSLQGLTHHLIGLEAEKIDTPFAEAVISVLNSGPWGFLVDTSGRKRLHWKTVLERFLQVVPEKSGAKRIEFRDCAKLRKELQQSVPSPTDVDKKEMQIVRDGGKLKVRVIVLRGPSGKPGANGYFPGSATDGEEAPEVRYDRPGIEDVVVVASSGKGGRGGDGFDNEPGREGGAGGHVFVSVGENCSVAAFAGDGGVGGDGG